MMPGLRKGRYGARMKSSQEIRRSIMHTAQSTCTIETRTEGLTSRLWRALRRAWLGFWRWRSLNATVAVLGGLDDRMLKDIGIDRSEIESIAYTSGAERRRRYVEMATGTCRG
jgi:uncharacterized protein YjiS (DUF1127 family)